jgi:all-trans-8'-apo-beta-carotenal 15,15'-oxygenase
MTNTINRRHALGAAAAACALPSVWAQKASATPEDFKTQFAQSAAKNPSLGGLRSVNADLACDALKVEGKWPLALQGRFYRNGPALHERGDQRYQHWFAGDGMVQQFNIAAGRLSHQGRLVRTAKFKQEQASGKFLVPGFGTHIDSTVRITGPDVMNTANTNAIEHAGRVLAMWEGGSAHGMDVKTLETTGPIAWQDGWSQMPFSAHPKVDPQGHLWNFGGAFGRILSYHIDAQGQLQKAQVAKLSIDPKKGGGMMHDMAVTERFLVVPIPPVVVRWDLVARGQVGEQAMYVTDDPLRVWVAPKDDISKAQLFELPSEMVFHVGNAHEDGDDIVLSYVGGADSNFLGGAAVNIMRGVVNATGTDTGKSALRLARLNLRTGAARVQTLVNDAVEFPRVHPQRVGVKANWLLQAEAWLPASTLTPSSIQFDGIALRNITTGAMQRYAYGQDFMPEEHVMVPMPNKSGELDAWVLGTAFHIPTQTTCLNVLQASNLGAGPVARAWLPYALPLGFHGNFTAA